MSFCSAAAARKKTYATNDSVCLSSLIGPCLPQLMDALMKERRPTKLLFPFSYSSCLALFDRCRRRINLPATVPYQTRHTGPAVDMARGHRDRVGIKDRGRWKNDKSVARYEQRARLGQSFQQLQPALKSHLLACEEKLGGLVCGRIQVAKLIWEQI